MAEAENRIIKFYCNSCNRETNHEVVADHSRKSVMYTQISPYDDRSESIWSEDVFQLLKCLGCDDVTYRHRNFFSEDHNVEFNESTGQMELLPSVEDVYPPREDRTKPYWVRSFKNSKEEHRREIASLFDEIYAARGKHANRLTAIGARTVLDILLTHQVGDAGSFASRVSALSEKLRLSEALGAAVSSIVGIGNAAAHRGTQPSDSELADLLDIVEEVLKAVYVTPEEHKELEKVLQTKADKIKKLTPPRSRNKSRGRERAEEPPGSAEVKTGDQNMESHNAGTRDPDGLSE